MRRLHLSSGLLWAGGISLVLFVGLQMWMHASLPRGSVPGDAFVQLQTWLGAGGGFALLSGLVTRFFPQLGLGAKIIDTSDIAAIARALSLHASDSATANSLTAAGISAFNTLRDKTFPNSGV